MPKICLNLLLVWLIPSILHPQNDFKGVVLDAQSREPIPYVNIGVIGKGIGTVSDEAGMFYLEWLPEKLGQGDMVQFSSLGYRPINIPVADLRSGNDHTPKYFMTPQVEELNEVVVTNAGMFESEELVGYESGDRRNYGYWKDNIALGGELATKIKMRKGLRRLDQFTFEVLGNISDSVLLRVNFYKADSKQDFPGTNINQSGKNILFTVTQNTSKVILPLAEYNLYVRDDFVVSLELVKVFGDGKIVLILAASQDRYTHSYKKYASKDEWKILKNSAMAYQVKTTVFRENPTRSEVKRIKMNEERPITSGYIFNGMNPLPGAEIKNLSTGFDTVTNEKGHYQINAAKGDLLKISAVGMKPITIEILEKKFVNIALERS
ncbi:carboxypeptidase-like regulatory domain-containing protein [Muriicola jejuensis]|uniref:Carboxypeptidase-like regulatory domain-containing protein n=1 Tax=Muriicola jejuensis TaxID=504488 RepID=A0A6P0UH58_9FLAO|nr:carboxypeptidase-like regulatory domain-containing protein [Muriicola jejuensis]NER11138.1 hypothetical protein [Muriicola jejuensis]